MFPAPRSKAIAATLVMTALLVVAAVAYQRPHAHLAARYWAAQLDTDDQQHAETTVRKIAALGHPGTAALVEALGSQRPHVARAAKTVLVEQIDAWSSLPWSEASLRVARLADALADAVPRFGPTARSDAADLADRLLRWPLDPAAVNPVRVVASCDAVLRAYSPPEGRPEVAGVGIAPGEQRRQAAAAKSPGAGGATAATAEPQGLLPSLARLPGGGLTIDSFPGEDAATSDARPLAVGDPAEPPALLGSASDGRPLTPRDGDAAPSSGKPTRPGDGPTAGLPEARPLAAEEPAFGLPGASQPSPPAELGQVETVDLMRWLGAADAGTVRAAKEELSRRGFGPTHLDLARRLFDPDPASRAELAAVLPRVAGIDAAAWLLQLAHDEHGDVRLAALSILATTGDPSLLGKVGEIAGRDPDPRVRRLAERPALGGRR